MPQAPSSFDAVMRCMHRITVTYLYLLTRTKTYLFANGESRERCMRLQVSSMLPSIVWNARGAVDNGLGPPVAQRP